MRSNTIKSFLIKSGLAASALFLAGTAFGQAQQINLTAAPASTTLPDGSTVPMWGYSCGTAITGTTATCKPLIPTVTGTTWSPVVITVPTGQDLQINLTNNLSFGTTPTNLPTSLTIVGQLGGGLGTVTASCNPASTATTGSTCTPSPGHAQLGVSWATTNTPGGTNPTFTPPPQGARVQSFGTEVAATPATTTQTATPLLWKAPKPGTYLLESGTHPSIQGPMGLYGIVVVTAAPTTAAAGTAYPAVTYDADVPMLLSEIDPVQNNAVSTAVNTAGFSEATVWSGQLGKCGNPTAPVGVINTCYPPVVNYLPLYYLFNGVAFNKTSAAASLFPASTTIPSPPLTGKGTGSVLVRLVNAGLRMHVPSIVGSLTGSTTPAASGFSLIAEDGNPLPGASRVQSEVFMAAGKTYDVMINAPAACAVVSPATTCSNSALPVFDRQLSLSGNGIDRDAGMLAYIGINGATLPAAAAAGNAASVVARPDSYFSPPLAGQTLTVSDPSLGLIANDTNVFGVQLLTATTNGTLTLNANGTFTYVPTGTGTGDSFTYCANGSVTGGVCASGKTAIVTLAACTTASLCLEGASGITVKPNTFTANTATYLAVKTPGMLAGAVDNKGYPLTVATTSITPSAGLTVVPDINGGFTATAAGAGTYTFTYKAQNSQGTQSASATVTLNFPQPTGLAVTVLDPTDTTHTPIGDYRWIIEEDRTFYIDPTTVANSGGTSIVPTLGVNFHTSYMPFVAQGCTGPLSCEGGQTVLGIPSVCDVGNGACRADPTGQGFTPVLPSQVHLDSTKRYYLSVLPGDAANPFIAGTSFAGSSYPKGHGMGGAPIGIDPNTKVQMAAVTVLTEPAPYPTAQLSVFVFEDDFPLNGEHDGGGGIDVVAPNEPGLGGFQIHLWDAMGGNGDFTGQMSYDFFNQPLSNSLAGTIDPNTHLNACPISVSERSGMIKDPTTGKMVPDPKQTGITGMIVTCPKYESDGKTLSPLAGQAVIANLMPGRFGVIATPAADRIARGEEWLQTNTLDGQKAHDAFARIGEPSFFQEFGPASYHVSVGFANPKIINDRKASVCNGTNLNITGPNCTNSITGTVTGQRLSRTPDERLYSSGTHDTFYWSQCYVSLGDPDGIDFAFTKCNPDGTFTLSGLPDGDWRITTFDQWNDQLVDGLSTPVRLAGGKTVNMEIAATQWQTNLYTRTFIDDNKDGISQNGEAGIPFSNVAVRLRDGSLENLIVTDFTGTANFNETFPLFSWYTVETDVTRYKNTGTHVVYDAGGPADGSFSCGQSGYPPCGNSLIGKYLANTAEQISLPTTLRVPGSVYCAGADCSGKSIQNGPATSAPPSACTTNPTGATTCSTTLSTGRIDNPWLGGVEGWQGFPGQNSFLEFGKEPYVAGENGGIKGHVVYASTRPFDDPQMLVQTQWEPLVPRVTINLYREGMTGTTPTLTLVDSTTTTSFDDWAQGFRADGTPNMNCPGQGAASGTNPDLFFFSLYNQPDYLDVYNSQHNGGAAHALPNNAQFKCYDGMHNWNQLQPAPYDGMYKFPSVTAVDANGKPTLTGTNCKICTANTAVPSSDLYYNTPMLPIGKYVVEVVVPPGMELVKEEDKNILIGDNFIAPVTQQFGNLGNVYIVPDQAAVAGAYNANNAQNPTSGFGTTPQNGIVPGFVPEPLWPCVGESRIVPDYISLFPQSKQVAPFAGATRNLCDRKEVTLADEMGAIAKFYVYTSTHVASKFTGGITDDYTSEFDPFSPQFGEKFAPPDLPVSVKDWTGAETNRVYADHWGAYNGMTYSTWEVNPPNPTGYAPTMMVFCMNDPGPILDTKMGSTTHGQLITDPLFTPGYSQFCYELPFMPGTTQYLDTPVVPTSAFAGAGYNNVDCAYPDATPALSEVDGDGVGPWVSAPGKTLSVTALGDQMVPNYAYSGPSATTAPFNQKTIKRHYGFGTAPGTVSVGGVTVPATTVTWGDLAISFPVPSGVPACGIQQQAQYSGSTALCGELIITAANGKQSIDTVTVTIGGKAPTHVLASGTIQGAIDAAAPGDLLIVDPTCNTANATGVACNTIGVNAKTTAAHNEILLMWKPIRLQGVGAASSIINANTHPAGKIDPWRREVNCLFGLALDGQPFSGPANPTANHPFDPTGTYSCGATANFSGTPTTLNYFAPSANNPQVDRQPLEATLGWDANLSGNVAELLQEPALMGALEGAGITVLSKGVYFPSNPYDPALFAGFPTNTVLFTANNVSTYCNGNYPSNFQCNPSSIDGLGITNSSQGGGGIFVHAWGHNLQIANNRVYNNSGTLAGGINLGQGEFPPGYLKGDAANAAPGSCENTGAAGSQLAYCHDINVNMHHNYVSMNNSTGDELFSATPAGAGGVSICTGSDYYKFNYNWVCGNLSSGDGGGVGHLGFSKNGDIEHNSILFNQSTNPTIPTNGGGLLIMGTPDVDPACGAVTDSDCVPALGTVGPSDGIGPGLVINANLIMGNAAESGSGGGVAFQHVNGGDVVAFPTRPGQWYGVQFTNNIVANNVAGWDGGGISLLDALKVDIVNNTIIGNVTTASSGVLTNTLGAPLASTQNCPPGGIDPVTGQCKVMITSSTPQPAGLVSINNTATLLANLPASGVNCPAAYNAPGAVLVNGTVPNGTCKSVSYPRLHNNVFWQNSPYYIAAGALSPQFQQNVVSMYNAFTNTLVASQPTADATTANGTGSIISGGTGACLASGTGYWDIGVRGDTGPNNHGSGITLNPRWSVLTPGATGYFRNNITTNPQVQRQYCDGSRQPPEACSATNGCGWAVPPGISDATVPNPIFNLTPVATVDEGNNWINLRWGPLSLVNPVNGTLLGNYALASSSSAIDYVPAPDEDAAGFPTTDFFGNPRPDASNPAAFDVGAVEFQGNAVVGTPVLSAITPASGVRGTSATVVSVTLTGTGLTGTRNVIVVNSPNIAVSNVVVVSDTTVTATFTVASATALGAHNVLVTAGALTSNTVTFTVTAPPPPALTSIAPNAGTRGTSVAVSLTGTGFTGATGLAFPGGAGGITVRGFTVVSDTGITATLVIPANSARVARNVRVNSPNRNTNSVTFTVK